MRFHLLAAPRVSHILWAPLQLLSCVGGSSFIPLIVGLCTHIRSFFSLRDFYMEKGFKQLSIALVTTELEYNYERNKTIN
jgi:hypothetical protein